MRKCVLGSVMAGVVLTGAACRSGPSPDAAAYEASASARTFPIAGVVQAVGADGRVTVAHEEIPGFMDAMTMSFAVKEPWVAKVAAPGDRLTGTLVVDAARSWIQGTSLTKPPEGTGSAAEPDAPASDGIGPAAGTPVPSVALQDQAGRTVTARDFAGRDLVVTFVYTRCPLPDFCPRMMARLNDAAARLHKAGRRDDVQMVAITIDPAHDTPDVLAEYGRTHIKEPDGDPFRRWSMLTGTPEAIAAWASFFALTYEKDGAEIAHGLRTAVIDREGKVVGILRGNDWTTNELMGLLPAR